MGPGNLLQQLTETRDTGVYQLVEGCDNFIMYTGAQPEGRAAGGGGGIVFPGPQGPWSPHHLLTSPGAPQTPSLWGFLGLHPKDGIDEITSHGCGFTLRPRPSRGQRLGVGLGLGGPTCKHVVGPLATSPPSGVFLTSPPQHNRRHLSPRLRESGGARGLRAGNAPRPSLSSPGISGTYVTLWFLKTLHSL